MKTAYLGLGSNLGDRLGILRAAIHGLRSDPAIRVTKISSLYATEPVGVTAQPEFLNLVTEIQTDHAPLALLAVTQRIENVLGRERRERWGPRTVDIDVLWYEGERSDAEVLILPHPRAKERSFVLTPWAEIAPGVELEGERVSVRAARLNASGVVRVGPWKDEGDAS